MRVIVVEYETAIEKTRIMMRSRIIVLILSP